MRDYGKVHTSFWGSKSIRAMSEDARTLAMYLLTCPHGTIAGVFRLPDGYVCEDIQWDADRVDRTLDELFENGFATRCKETKWVFVHKHMEWNPPENPNQIKSAAKVAQQIPDTCSWKSAFFDQFGAYLGLAKQSKIEKKKPLRNPSETVQVTVKETVSEPITITITEAITEAITGTGDKTKAAAQAPFVLPDWIPVDAWAAFMEVRKSKKAKNTDYALSLLVKAMEKIKGDGLDPLEALNNSIKAGWSDVYPPKGNTKGPPRPSGKHSGFSQFDYNEGIGKDGTLS